MDKIKGYVEHIVFRNDDNGYTVFHLNRSIPRINFMVFSFL